jgi:hypothetical protein
MRLERPRLGRHQPERRARESPQQMLDDGVAIDGEADGMAHPFVGQDAVTHVEGDIREVEPW